MFNTYKATDGKSPTVEALKLDSATVSKNKGRSFYDFIKDDLDGVFANKEEANMWFNIKILDDVKDFYLIDNANGTYSLLKESFFSKKYLINSKS